ncbi:MAG: hemolysin family protein [Anaerovoracaceae bacterium]
MSSDSISLQYYIIAIIVVSLVNALVCASKRALDYLDRSEIKEMLEDDPDNRRLIHVTEFIKRPSTYHYADHIMSFAMILIAFALFNIGFARELSVPKMIASNIVFFVVYTAISDILPKKLAAQNSEAIGIKLVMFQRLIYIITLPFELLCVSLTNLILVILRKDTDVDDSYFTEDKVMSMLDKGQETGEIKEDGRKMIDSIFEFDDLLAYEIMTPRTDVFMIDLEDDREDYFEELMELTHSRIPVCEGDADNIIGMLHIKDYLLKASHEGFDNVNIRELLRPVYLVPETKNIDALFKELQKEKHHIAILIDEYGGFSGIVSVEDIIEQIVGDIDDEYDEADRVIEKIDDTTYVVDGNVYLDDLDDETPVSLESDNSETVGGFVIDLMGEIPKEENSYSPISYENYDFTILSVKDRRIEKLKIQIMDRDKNEQ